MSNFNIEQTSYIALSSRSTGFFKTISKSIYFAFVFAIISTLLGGSAAYAQLDQGTLAGTVRDSTDAAIPNATVTLVNEATGLSLVRTADGAGIFTFTPIKIGSYTVTVFAQGFSTAVQKGIIVNASSRIEIPITLTNGSVSQTVEVTTDPALLQTDDASTGATISAKVIVQTPLLTRNPIFIAQLTPGVVAAEDGSRGGAKGDFSASGQRSGQNNFIFDGVDNNAMLVDLPNGSSYVIKPIPDSLAEFKVQTSSYNAELGRAAGAVVIASMKSGANQLHGSLWEFWRNDVLNARDFFQPSKPKYRQNQFGATLGGPFIKDKLFFFGDVEANRIIFGQSGIYTVPTALMRTGDFSELLNPALVGGTNSVRPLYVPGSAGTVALQCNGALNVICPANVNKVAQNILSLLPAPNFGVPGQTYNNFNFLGGASDNTTQFDGRIDWNPSQSDQAFVKYSSTNQVQTFPSIFGLLDGSGFGTSGNVTDKGRQFTLSETHFFSPTLSNEFRVGYNWINAQYAQPNSGTDVSSQLGLGGIPFAPGNGGLPFFSFGGGQNIGNNVSAGLTSFGSAEYLPTNEYENVAQLLDNVSKTIGKHSLKGGVSFQRIRIQTLQIPEARGAYVFDGKYTQLPGSVNPTGFGGADFLLNQMDSAQLSNFSTSHEQRWYRSGYFQDNWRISPALTIDMGIRYEFFQPLSELDGKQANFVVNFANNTATFLLPKKAQQTPLPASLLNALAGNNVPVVYDSNPALVDAQKTNFGPRFGFTYGGINKTVIRGGFGLFFGDFENVGYSPNLAMNAPFLFTSNFASGVCTVGNCPTNGLTLENGFSTALAAGIDNYINTPAFRMYPAKIKTTYTESFNVAVQRELNSSTTVAAAYVGALGRHVTSNPDANQIPYLLTAGQNVQANRPFNQFASSSVESYDGQSNYNGLQVTAEHRSANGLYFMANYTWSKSLDNAFLPLGGGSQKGYRNWRQLGYSFDYGPSFVDTRHRFVINSQYALPIGHGRKYLNQSKIADELAGGWSLSLLFRVQTGQPNVLNAGNSPTNGVGNADAVTIGDPFSTGGTNPGVTCATKTHTVGTWFNPCSFTNPLPATGPNDIAAYGPAGRQVVYGPGYNRIDLSLFKSFSIWRESALDFRVDLFNALNTPAYGNPNTTVGSGFGQITSSRFGGTGIAAESPDARVAQLSAKLHF